MSKYTELLTKTWDDLPDDVILPEGTYLARGVRGAIFEPRTEDGTPQAVIDCKPTEALEDVDADELAALGDDFDMSMVKVQWMTFLDDMSKFAQVRRALDTFEVLDGSKSITENIKDVRKQDIKIVVGVRTYQDKNTGEPRTVNNIKAFLPLDD